MGMDKDEVAAVLLEIGTLLELKGENPFKTRAYQNGARILEGLTEPLEKIVAENRLGELKGFGEALQEKVTRLVTTGTLPAGLTLTGAGVLTGTFDAHFLSALPARIFGTVNNTSLIAVPLAYGEAFALIGSGDREEESWIERPAGDPRHRLLIFLEVLAITLTPFTIVLGLSNGERGPHYTIHQLRPRRGKPEEVQP